MKRWQSWDSAQTPDLWLGGKKAWVNYSLKSKKKSGKVLLFWSPVLNGAPYLVPLTNREADLSGTVLIVGQRLLVRRWQLLLHHQCQTQPLEISMFLQSNVKAHICRGADLPCRIKKDSFIKINISKKVDSLCRRRQMSCSQKIATGKMQTWLQHRINHLTWLNDA